jgi:hypothetical protein
MTNEMVDAMASLTDDDLEEKADGWEALDAEAAQPEPQLDCAERIIRGDQGPTINQAVSSIAVTIIWQLLRGECDWMAAYFDLEDGSMKPVLVDPKCIARMSGLHTNQIAPPNPEGKNRPTIAITPPNSEGKSKALVDVLTEESDDEDVRAVA